MISKPRRLFLIILFLVTISAITIVFFKREQRQTMQYTTLPVLGSSHAKATATFPQLLPPTDTSLISLEKMFTYEDPNLAEFSNDANTVTVLATGDVIPARSVNAATVSKNDFTFPFIPTASFLQRADMVFINLESPLIPSCSITQEGMQFCGDERNIEGLRFANVTVASVANNHMGNYGIDGVTNTVKLLQQHSISVTGHRDPAVIQKKGISFGFLGYNDIGGNEAGIAWADQDAIQSDIQKLRSSVDILLVTFHWGVEYVSDPTLHQRQLAHRAIDAGADVVIGNHPHWVQGIEQYNGKLITYAHGNFVFDQMWSQETREGVVGKYVFTRNGLVGVRFYPIIIDHYAQPRFANQEEATTILSRMKLSSTYILSQPFH